MRDIVNSCTVIVAAVALAGCGGSGTQVVTGAPQPASFNLGTAAGATVAASGLPFAQAGTSQSVPTGVPITIRAVGYENVHETADPQIQLLAQQVVLNAGTSLFEGNHSFFIEGERIDFDGANARLANGEDASSGSLTSRNGVFVGVVQVSGAVDVPGAARLRPNTEWRFLSGFETDPAVIGPLAGTVVYAAALSGQGLLLSGPQGVPISDGGIGGSARLTVNLDANTVDADLVARIGVEPGGFESGFVAERFDLTLADAPIAGNGFQGPLTVGCDVGLTCTGGGEMGAAFFGPTAEEIGGLAAIDVVLSGGAIGTAKAFRGQASFVATPLTP